MFENRQEMHPEGMKDQGCGKSGKFLGRAYKVQKFGGQASVQGYIESESDEIDQGIAERVEEWQRHAKKNVGGLYGAGDYYDYVWVTRLPVAPFTFFRRGPFSRARSFIPYVNQCSIILNFKPEYLKFMNMFQSSNLLGNEAGVPGCLLAEQNANAATGGQCTLANSLSQIENTTSRVAFTGDNLAKPSLRVKWVAPAKGMQLANSYSFLVPKYPRSSQPNNTDRHSFLSPHNFSEVNVIGITTRLVYYKILEPLLVHRQDSFSYLRIVSH